MGRDNLLIVADSDHDADMLYAVRMFVPDPFIFLRVKGRCHVVMSDLEIDRGRKQAPHCRAVSLTQCIKSIGYQRLRGPGTPRQHPVPMRTDLLVRCNSAGQDQCG